jgi:drug/metabolite transporter (DMT)-like permease
MDLFAGLVFGAIGTGYLVYAKRQYSALFAVAGALLIIFPYFVSSAWLTCLIGAALTAAPFVYQRVVER